MAKQIAFGVVWCVVFYFGLCMIVGAVAGGMAAANMQPGEDPHVVGALAGGARGPSRTLADRRRSSLRCRRRLDLRNPARHTCPSDAGDRNPLSTVRHQFLVNPPRRNGQLFGRRSRNIARHALAR